MAEHSKLTDQEVGEEWVRKANVLSGYNAAEGLCWYEERAERRWSNTAFNEINSELKKRKLDRPAGSYLL